MVVYRKKQYDEFNKLFEDGEASETIKAKFRSFDEIAQMYIATQAKDVKMQEWLADNASIKIKRMLAVNSDIDKEIAQQLYDLKDNTILSALAKNSVPQLSGLHEQMAAELPDSTMLISICKNSYISDETRRTLKQRLLNSSYASIKFIAESTLVKGDQYF